MKPVHLIGVPLDLGAGRRGVDMGPSAFRIAGLAPQLTSLGRTVADRGNVPSPLRERATVGDQRKKYVDAIAGVCRALFEEATAVLEAGAVPLVLGGDHSLGAGSVAASSAWVRRTTGRPVGLLWVDAHGDINTPATSESGNVHGMPLAALLGQEPRELTGFDGQSPATPSVVAAHTVLVGIRNLDDREKDQIREAGVHVFTMKDIDRLGMARVAELAIRAATDGTGGLHVSFDMDVCDPAIAPGVGTPVRGGLGYREAHLLMELVSDARALVALDLVEVNPTLDARNTTAELGTELALSAFGKSIL